VLLIHARLVGRLAWLLHRLDQRPGKAAKPAKRKAPGPAGKKRPRPRRGVSVSDPWAIPETEPEEPQTGPVYRVAEGPAEQGPAPLLDDPDPYTVRHEPAAPPGQAPPHRTALEENKVQREVELRTRREPEVPPSPLFSGTYSFPLYATNHRNLVWLTVWSLASALFLLGAIKFWPRGG
jgi:hypothetical protein